jgi:hypothetical protein
MANIHTAYNRTYSIYDIPDIVGNYEITVVGIRLKLNRLIWNSHNFLQNPLLVTELSRRSKNIRGK